MSALSEFKGAIDLLNSLEGKDWAKKLAAPFFFVYFAALFVIVVLFFVQTGFFNYKPVATVTNSLAAVGIVEDLAKGFLAILTVVTVVLIAAAFLWLKDRLCIICTIGLCYVWEPKKGLADWDFEGEVLVDGVESSLHIVRSDLGCIIKPKGLLRTRSWRNFDMCFEFKVPKGNQLEGGFGIIYRAQQLGQYYMLKVDKKGYKPHVRNVFWDPGEPVAMPQLTTNDLDSWVAVRLSVRGSDVSVSIGPDSFDFVMPSYSNVSRDTSQSIKSGRDEFESLPYKKIPFRRRGTVGFRSARHEEVYIRKLVVKSEPFRTALVRELREVKGKLKK